MWICYRWVLRQQNFLISNSSLIVFFFSPWDFAKFLRMQCQFNSISYPRWAKKWINIRKEFASFYSVQRCGMKINL
jgi:hypothetical protein